MGGKNTKEEIMRTAFDQFVNNSYDGVSINQIADETEVSKGAIFHYFDSKFELASESMMDHIENNWMPVFMELYKIEDGESLLEKMIDLSFDIFLKNPKLMRFLMELYERNQENDLIEGQFDDFYIEMLEMGAKMFEDLEAENPKLKSHLLTACIDGLTLQYTFLEDYENLPNTEELKKETFRIFSRGE